MPIDPAALIRQRGLQVTVQRVARSRAVSNEPDVTADGVVETVRVHLGPVGVRRLRAFDRDGPFRRIRAAEVAGPLEAR